MGVVLRPQRRRVPQASGILLASNSPRLSLVQGTTSLAGLNWGVGGLGPSGATALCVDFTGSRQHLARCTA